MNASPVSVVVASYNHAVFVREAVESALRQTLPPQQVVVVDDGSTDESLAVLEQLACENPGRVDVLSQPNRGVSATLNRGIRHTSTPYVAILASDDAYEPEKLARQVAYLEEHPDVLAVFTDGRTFTQEDGLGPLLSSRWPLDAPFTFDHVMRQRVAWIAPSMLLRREAFDRLGGYDETLGWEDFDFVARLTVVGTVAYLPEMLFRYRVGRSESLSGRVDLMERDYERVVAKLADAGHLNAAQKTDYLAAVFLKIGQRYYAVRDLRNARRLLLRSFRLRPSWAAGVLLLRTLLGPRLIARLSALRQGKS